MTLPTTKLNASLPTAPAPSNAAPRPAPASPAAKLDTPPVQSGAPKSVAPGVERAFAKTERKDPVDRLFARLTAANKDWAALPTSMACAAATLVIWGGTDLRREILNAKTDAQRKVLVALLDKNTNGNGATFLATLQMAYERASPAYVKKLAEKCHSLEIVWRSENDVGNRKALDIVAFLLFDEARVSKLPSRDQNRLLMLLLGENGVSAIARSSLDETAAQASVDENFWQRFLQNYSKDFVMAEAVSATSNRSCVVSGPLSREIQFESKTAAAREYEISFPGQRIFVDIPENSKEPLLSIDTVARMLAGMPDGQRALIRQVFVNPEHSSLDTPGREVAMRAGAAGVVNVYPCTANDSKDFLAGTIIHESGHILAGHTGKDAWLNKAWPEAQASDGLVVSGYSRTSSSEDFGETVVAYLAAWDKTESSELRAMFPARFAILDKLIDVDRAMRESWERVLSAPTPLREALTTVGGEEVKRIIALAKTISGDKRLEDLIVDARPERVTAVLAQYLANVAPALGAEEAWWHAQDLISALRKIYESH